MSKSSRLLAGAAAAVLASCALITTAEGKKKPVRMVGTRTLPSFVKLDHGTAYFSITHAKRGLQYAAGNNYDSVLGTGAVTYVLKLLPGPTGTVRVTSNKVVLYAGRGSLSGTASATVITTPTSQTITGGKLSLTKGFGSLAGDQLVAKFTGTADLAANVIVFHYKGALMG